MIIDFIQVIEDASDYLFSINHSQSYSYIGYTCAWLRYYYPLEFLTALLNVSKDNQEKTTNAFEYINQFTDINVKSIKFRGSLGEYTINREENAIYKGIASIKYLSENLANELYELRDNKYETFVDLLIDIKEKTSCNSRQLQILIKLDFFSEFGKAKKLLSIVELQDYIGKNRISVAKVEESPFTLEQIERHSARRTPKTFMEVDFNDMVREIIQSIPDDDLSIKEKADAQLENLGYIDLQLGVDAKNCYVTSVDTKYTPRVQVVSLDKGKTVEFRVKKDYFSHLNLEVGDIIYMHNMESRQAYRPDGYHKNGKMKFAKIEGKFNLYCTNCEKIEEKDLYIDRSDRDIY